MVHQGPAMPMFLQTPPHSRIGQIYSTRGPGRGLDSPDFCLISRVYRGGERMSISKSNIEKTNKLLEIRAKLKAREIDVEELLGKLKW